MYGGGGRHCTDHRDIPAPDTLHSAARARQGIPPLSECELWQERERVCVRERERESRKRNGREKKVVGISILESC